MIFAGLRHSHANLSLENVIVHNVSILHVAVSSTTYTHTSHWVNLEIGFLIIYTTSLILKIQESRGGVNLLKHLNSHLVMEMLICFSLGLAAMMFHCSGSSHTLYRNACNSGILFCDLHYVVNSNCYWKINVIYISRMHVKMYMMSK